MSAAAPIAFELDGQAVSAFEGESILQAAERHGVAIPRLCFTDGLRADGNCRACVVEVEGERTLAPSCCRAVQPGMKVRAASERARQSQNLVLELLLAELPAQGHKWLDDDATQPHGELSQWAAQRSIHVRDALQTLKRTQPAPDLSHPAMAVNLDACIQCTRCVRACREAQVNDVIGYAGRGAEARIVFDLGDAMGASSCVACGECVQACPTGALIPKTHIGPQRVDRSVDSVCPFCGVGCQITYHVRDEKIVSVSGRGGPANAGRLCVKGRFGFDYVASPDRLTAPADPQAGRAQGRGALRAAAPTGARCFAKPPGTRRSSWPPAVCRRSRPDTAPRPWPALAAPRAATRRPTCSRSWCAPALAATTSTTAPACATPAAWRRCWRAWARAPSATRCATWNMPS
ncbi:hypothetical protein MASR1M50_27130 [Burkholderiales bacterium]